MPELGNRANVMGPQPIAHRKPTPPAVKEAAEHVLKLLAEGARAELEALAMPAALSAVAALGAAAHAGAYDKRETIAIARINQHYYLKASLTGTNVQPLIVQIRLGERDGRWMIWEANNLTGCRSGWSR